MGGTEYKISTYADDMLYTLTNPIVSLSNLLQEMEIYGSLSNFNIHFSKSEAMGVPISKEVLRALKSNCKFKWTDKSLNYLGTYIPGDLSQIYKLHFPPLLSKVWILLEGWQRVFHFWFGRCNIIKINILQTFLYLFQTLPIAIPKHFFKQNTFPVY